MAVVLCSAFAAGIVLGAEIGLHAGLAGAVLVGLATVRWRAALAVAATIALGALAGRHELGPAPLCPVGAEMWEATIVRPLEDGVVADVGGVPTLLRAPGLLPGDRVRFRGVIEAPGPIYRNDGQPDLLRIWRGRGVWAIARIYPPGPVLVAAGFAPWRPAAAIRARAAAAIESPLVQALVLGKRDSVPDTVEEDFRRAGVTHVLSVSGLHLLAVTFLFYVGARRAWLRFPRLALRISADRVAAAAALPIAVGYTLVTGAAVATLRALVCAGVVLGARILGRRPDAPAAIAVAALAILAVSPLALYDPSFQLSFAAALGLAVCSGGGGWLRRMIRASGVAFLATAPFTALHFGVLQPAGIVANLVVVPLAELVILPLGLAGAALAAIPLGPLLLRLAGLAADGLAFLVHQIARVAPVWEVSPPRPLELMLLLVGLVALWRRRGWVVAACSVAVAVSYGWPHRPEGLRVTFLDVGQGDAAVVETAGAVWLVDAGGRLFGNQGPDPGERAVWPFLRAHRIGRIDVAVLSHPHPDHFGGLAAVAAHVPIGEVWVNGETGDEAYRALLANLAAAGTRIVRPAPGERRNSGGAALVAVGPAEPDPLASVNDNSLVVRVDFAGRRVLFPGDLEAGGEAALGGSPADVVKVPHHGSRTSSTPGFVAHARPAIAVVSCGRRNRFGFPDPAVVLRWGAGGAGVFRTDVLGQIRLTVTPEGAILPPDVSPARRHRRARDADRARVRAGARGRAGRAPPRRGRAPAPPGGGGRAPPPGA